MASPAEVAAFYKKRRLNQSADQQSQSDAAAPTVPETVTPDKHVSPIQSRRRVTTSIPAGLRRQSTPADEIPPSTIDMKKAAQNLQLEDVLPTDPAQRAVLFERLPRELWIVTELRVGEERTRSQAEVATLLGMRESDVRRQEKKATRLIHHLIVSEGVLGQDVETDNAPQEQPTKKQTKLEEQFGALPTKKQAEILSLLTEREREVIKASLGLDGSEKLSRQQMAEALEIGVQRLAKIERTIVQVITDPEKAKSRLERKTAERKFSRPQEVAQVYLVFGPQVETGDLTSLALLSDKERRIVELRLGLDGTGQKSIAKVAEILGTSRQAVQQAERRAILRITDPDSAKLKPNKRGRSPRIYQLFNDENTERYEEMLAMLTPRQREFAELRLGLDGNGKRSIEQAAEALGLSVSGVYTLEETIFKRITNPREPKKTTPKRPAQKIQIPNGISGKPDMTGRQSTDEKSESAPRARRKTRLDAIFETLPPERQTEMLDLLPSNLKSAVTSSLGLDGNGRKTAQQIADTLGLAASTVTGYLVQAAKLLSNPETAKGKSEARKAIQREKELEDIELMTDQELEILAAKKDKEEPAADSRIRVDGFGAYLRRIGQFPLLTAAQEVILAKLYEGELAQQQRFEGLRAQGKPVTEPTVFELLKKSFRNRNPNSEFTESIDPKDREKFRQVILESSSVKDLFMNCNLRLVVSVARRTKPFALTLQDRDQAGKKGLIRALEKFDYTKGYKFSTYATWWIKQAITREVADTANEIRLPIYVADMKDTYGRERNAFLAENRREPTEAEMIEILDPDGEHRIAVTNIVRYLNSPESRLVYLNQRVSNGKGEPGDTEIGDLIEDRGANTEEDALSSVHRQEMARKLLSALDGELTTREKAIFLMRHGFVLDADGNLEYNEKLTLEDVGKEFGVTRERIRQIEGKVTKKLQNNAAFRELGGVSGIQLPELQPEKEITGPGRGASSRLTKILPDDPAERTALIGQLPLELRQIVELRVNGGEIKSLAEIGTLLGMGQTAVSRREKQAIEMLQTFRSGKSPSEQPSTASTTSLPHDKTDHPGNHRITNIQKAFGTMLEDGNHAVLDLLTPAQRRIVELRLGLDGNGPKTAQQTATAVGTSLNNVYMAEANAIKRVKSLTEISDQERAVIEMTDAGMTKYEIAQRLDISSQLAIKLEQRAREKLARKAKIEGSVEIEEGSKQTDRGAVVYDFGERLARRLDEQHDRQHDHHHADPSADINLLGESEEPDGWYSHDTSLRETRRDERAAGDNFDDL